MTFHEKIVATIADWNSIGIDNELAKEEYKKYVPMIILALEKGAIMNCLEDILINQLEIGYDSTNPDHYKDVQKVCNDLMRAYKTVL